MQTNLLPRLVRKRKTILIIRSIPFLIFFIAAWATNLAAEEKSYDPCGRLDILNRRHQKLRTSETRSQLAIGYNNCGLFYADQKKWNTAETYLQKARQVEESSLVLKNLANILSWRGHEAFEANDFRAAKEDFEKALLYDPGNPDIKIFLSQALYRIDSRSHEAHALLAEGAGAATVGGETWQQRAKQLGHEAEIEKNSREEKKGNWILRIQENLPEIKTEDTFKMIEDVSYELGKDFEYWVKHPVVIVLTDAEQFSRIHSGAGWAGAINDGRIKVPVTGVFSAPEKFKSVLAHELTHSIVNALTHGQFVPFLIHEGFAEYEEDKISGKTEFRISDYTLLPHAFKAGTLIPLQALCEEDVSLKLDPVQAGLAYEEARSFVFYLADVYQFYSLRTVLKEIGKGASFEDAFQLGIGTRLSFLEEEWKAWLAHQSGK